ncbi:uncharacterized protein BT62DRAFT_260410 [Guyanagaster necrorhizus]|uniref:F-box domain-containing protein n=1 Tax=Guyanagaster necrorhizus TaxID=856835 RepID=A0A9P8AQC9_9AGAR|nr:uncharacterized protein BT62DRAFT_260410 [Guyanagaster necrorhizus MCA 3950]KAG7444228.1 hypothetical protein BT62DRAFT_260410 [Guyanagaster necrorhizus MCA 3950]
MSLISVSNVLGTNYAPNEHDSVVVQKSLSEQEKLLEQLRAQKVDLEQQLLVVNQREAQIVKTVADHRTLLRASPMRSLPAELLGEIFLAHCAGYPDFDNDGAVFRMSRLRLLAVCTRWRDVALSTPRIWAALSVDCVRWYGFTEEYFESRFSAIKGWVSSSGRLPLSIGFRFVETSHRHDYQITMFNTIFAQLHRCKSFSGRINFDPDCHDPVQRAVDQDIPDAPMLESLSLRSYRINTATISWRRNLYAKIPRLRHLDIDDASAVVSLPVQDIITVKLETATLSDLFYLVENAAVLEELQLGVVKQSDLPQPGRRDPRRLDSLVSVHFQYTSSVMVNQFIDYVTLPSINELIIRATPSWPDTDAFMPFFRRSACSLTKLIIMAADADKHGFLLGVLPLVPSLQVLRIENRDYHGPLHPLPSTVLDYLTGKPKRQNLTAVADLQISVQLRQMASVKRLLDCRHTRWEKLGVARLNCFSITIVTARLSTYQMKDRRQQMLEVFEPYKKAGLSMTWTIRSR